MRFLGVQLQPKCCQGAWECLALLCGHWEYPYQTKGAFKMGETKASSMRFWSSALLWPRKRRSTSAGTGPRTLVPNSLIF